MNEQQMREAIKYRLKLKKNYLAILKNLRADEIGGFLYQEGTITDDQWGDVNNLRLGERERMHKLYDIIYQTPDDRMETAFQTFIRSFETESDWLADQIIQAKVTPEDVEAELQRFIQRYPAPQYAVIGLPSPGTSLSVSTNASTSSNSNAATMAGTEEGATSSAASGVASISNQHVGGQVASQHTTSAGPIEPMQQEEEIPGTENQPNTIAYTACILVYRFIRVMWPGSSARHTESATSSAGPSTSRQPHAPLALESSDESDGEIRNVSYRNLADEFDSESRALGVGQLQTTLDMRGAVKSLRELGDLFDQQYGSRIDAMVDIAIQGNIQDSPNWFVKLVREVLSDGITWGRIVSLFVFSSRFAFLAIRRATGNVVRWLGTVVFGFADFIRDEAASWLSHEGGWNSLLDRRVTSGIRHQMSDEQQLRSVPRPNTEPQPSPSADSPLLSRRTVILGAVLAISAGAYVWYRGGR